VVSVEDVRAAVEASVPAGTTKLNLQAFDAGVEHFRRTCGDAAASDPSRQKRTGRQAIESTAPSGA
jgi:hypothetical protein